MFEYNDKRRLYWLIDQYLLHKMPIWEFENEYYKSYCLETNLDTLSEEEEKAFNALADVATRFSYFEEDHKNHPGVYYTFEELHQKILETKNALKNCWLNQEKF